MAASVTSSIASLILTLDNPDRDDLSTVKVWASTTNGFTPNDLTNLVYTGNALTIVLANLTPLTLYYIKYAYISEIDPTDFTISAQLSGTPNKIDGSIIVDGSISANQISATALRGKMFVGNVLMDLGTIATSNITATGNPTTTFTLNVLDTVDFPTSGALLIVSKTQPQWISVARYTGKTSTSFTGLSGIEIASVTSGDAILPILAMGFQTDSNGYSGGAQWITTAAGYGFRRSGGSALAIHKDYVADLFTYTSQGEYTGGLAYEFFNGVSGLNTWSGYSKVIVDNNDLPTATIAVSNSYNTLTINKTDDIRLPAAGTIFLVSTTVVGVKAIVYRSYSGTTITFNNTEFLDAATYYVIPGYSITAVGGGEHIVTATNCDVVDGAIKIQKIGNILNQFGTSTFNGSVQISSSQSDDTPVEEIPSHALTLVGKTISNGEIFPLHINSLFLPVTFSPDNYPGSMGMCENSGVFFSDQNYLPVIYNGSSASPTHYFLQGMAAQHYFSNPLSPTYDSINFDDSTNTYSFNVDGGIGNGNIDALRLALGTAPVSSSISINIDDSMSVNGTRYGIANSLNVTNATLTADRTIRAAFNQVIGTYQNSAAFNASLYGAWNEAQIDETSGNSVDNEGTLYGSYNYALHNTDSATFTRVEDAYAVYAYTYSAGNTARIDDAFGVYARVRTAGTPASPNTAITRAFGLYSYIDCGADRGIGTAYNLYLTSSDVGTITTKWGIYQVNDWPHYLQGNVNFVGALNVVPTVSVPTTGSTITLTTSSSVLCLNHTATIATLTINFPSSPSDGHCISICSRAAVTTLTLGNGTFRGAITTIAAGGFAEYIYSTTGAAWFRKG